MPNPTGPDPSRQFDHDGILWRARRQPAVWAGTLSKGVSPPPAPEAGIWFTSEAGERRFLKMSYPNELPSQQEFADLDDDELIVFFKRAAPISQ